MPTLEVYPFANLLRIKASSDDASYITKHIYNKDCQAIFFIIRDYLGESIVTNNMYGTLYIITTEEYAFLHHIYITPNVPLPATPIFLKYLSYLLFWSLMYNVISIHNTCTACPAQWEGTLDDGRMIYIRYRHSHLTVHVSVNPTTNISDAVRGDRVFESYTSEDDGGYLSYKQIYSILCDLITLPLEESPFLEHLHRA